MAEPRVTAAVLLIGDELLSGRTQDVNLIAIARFLAPLGVEVREARVTPDDPDAIVAAVNALRRAYDYVFTTGGVGPTHDDKTADAVAAAFGVAIGVREDARALLEAHYQGGALNQARLKMARIPEGASLIKNPVSRLPGFQLENVFVLAGVPTVMRAMLLDVAHRIRGGRVVHAATYELDRTKEGDIAETLARAQERLAEVQIGSYPSFAPPDGYCVRVVLRSTSQARLAEAREILAAMLAGGVWREAQ